MKSVGRFTVSGRTLDGGSKLRRRTRPTDENIEYCCWRQSGSFDLPNGMGKVAAKARDAQAIFQQLSRPLENGCTLGSEEERVSKWRDGSSRLSVDKSSRSEEM